MPDLDTLPTTSTYLTFTVGETRYAVESLAVVEVFFLPEFTPVPEVPHYVVGVINVRGQLMPVVNLQLRFGFALLPYQLSDRIIILAAQGQRFGIIVQDIQGVEAISPHQIQTHLTQSWQQTHEESATAVQTGMATQGDNILVLLDVARLLRSPQTPPAPALEQLQDLTPEAIASLRQSLNDLEGTTVAIPTFGQQVTPEAYAVFRDRATQLAATPTTTATEDTTAIALIQLGDEYFGLDLQHIREFTTITRITPIPCCPPHIIGNTNLRGEIITIVDISAFVDLPNLSHSDHYDAVIIEAAGIVVGIVVTDVLDVYPMAEPQIRGLPTAIQGVARDIIEGEFPYHRHMAGLINIPQLLAQPSFQVNSNSS